MSPLVRAQVTPLRKTLATRVARVRFLSRVNPLVDLQMADAVKALSTERADEPFLPDRTTCYCFVELGVVEEKESVVGVEG